MSPGKMLMDDKSCFLVFSNEKVLALHKGAEERRAVSGHEMRNPSTGPPGCATPAPGYAGARSSEATSSQCLHEEGANRETSTRSLPSASSVAMLSPGNASFRPAKLTLQPTNRLARGARATCSVLTRGIHTGGLASGCAWPFRELRSGTLAPSYRGKFQSKTLSQTSGGIVSLRNQRPTWPENCSLVQRAEGRGPGTGRV